MKIYKVVPYAGTVVLRKGELAQDAVVRYFDVINQECVDGWEFLNLCPITVTRRLGRLRSRNETYHAFIFNKEQIYE